MLITNMRSPRTGQPVANQFIINHNGAIVFQSYQTAVCAVTDKGVYLSIKAFDYSRTTTKYLFEFFKGFGLDRSVWEKVRTATRKGFITKDHGFRFEPLTESDLTELVRGWR